MSDIEVEITGLDALEAALENLGGAEARAITKAGLSEGGEALRQAMQVESAGSFSGEVAQLAGQKSSWSKSTRMQSDLSGVTRVSPKASLPELHLSEGKGRQPKGKLYRRSLAYLIKLAEFGTAGGKSRGDIKRTMPMSRGFELYKGAVLERVISVIKDRLHLD